MMIDFKSTMLGFADYYRFPERRASWGGPFNGQSGRKALFDSLIESISPAAIVETGTYRGTTTEYMAKVCLPIYTVEGLARNYGFACARFWRKRNVHLYQGDSREVLRNLFANELKSLRNRTIFAYLDAHWNADLPLRGELEIIYANCPSAVVMIDDFQVPDDPGYTYDDYGPGASLTHTYIEPALSKFGLVSYSPSLPSSVETGSKRGCVIVANKSSHAGLLKRSNLLRDLTDLRRVTHQDNF